MNRWGSGIVGESPATVEPRAHDEPAKLTVETIDNHVYFYSGVNSDRCLALIKSLREMDKQLRNEAISRDLPPNFPSVPIWLHINSPGGSLIPALALVDQIKRIATPIYSVVEGECASAATFISMPCRKRYITPSSYMLIHQFSSFAWGTYEQLKDDMRLNDMLIEQMAKFYEAHSRLSVAQVRDYLQHDSWFNAEESLGYGFVDEILYS